MNCWIIENWIIFIASAWVGKFLKQSQILIFHIYGKWEKMKYIYQTPFRYFFQPSSLKKNLEEQKYAKYDKSPHRWANNKGNVDADTDQPLLKGMIVSRNPGPGNNLSMDCKPLGPIHPHSVKCSSRLQFTCL